ncbi:uncharacterized protein LOC119068354 isoform X2 [Bradysia coprophila]|uniref:uncharacterized protein LOC119068354 isoform X2 n=1 Tax=Bradysia coprophila TaxID=38358 RepID=UPI00187DCFCA|nr:uncharacterized protein LOC119068354 isoform X2 [Bradysia coprophila]
MASKILKPRIIKNLKNCCYVLSQTWSSALKYHDQFKGRKLQPKCYWTLHGLWLCDKDDLDLKFEVENWFENDGTFEYPTNRHVLADLQAIAPDIHPDTWQKILHKRMYNKHGKVIVQCNSELGPTQPTSTITTSEAYFKKAVESAFQYNIGKYIKSTCLGCKLDLNAASIYLAA